MDAGSGATVLEELVKRWREEFPPVWLGSETDNLTGRALRWRTIQNKRQKGEIPPECFVRSQSGLRVMVLRDPFLDWWKTTLCPAQQFNKNYDPHNYRGKRSEESGNEAA
jgi:hypothetical protein